MINKQQQLIYPTSAWDSYRWNQFCSANRDTFQTLAQGKEKVGSAFNSFALEVFHRIHLDKFYPNSGTFALSRLPNIAPEAQWAEHCHNELDQLPEWQELIGQCGGDRVIAGVATNQFCLKLAETLPTPPNPLADINALRNQVKGLKEFEQYLKDNGGSQSQLENLRQTIQNLIQKGKEAVEQAAQYAQQIRKYANTSMFRLNLKVAARNALTTATETKENLNLIGLDRSCDTVAQGGDIKSKLTLANYFSNSEKLKAIAKQAGRLKRMREQFGGKKQTPFWDIANIPVDITLGNNLPRLVTHELAYLADDDLFLAFADNYINRNLMEIKMGDVVSEVMGAIVVLVDNSTSMNGDREIWSKAIALNLAHSAQNNERDFCLIHFTTDVVRIDYFPKEQFDRGKLIKSICYFKGGGTNFATPLRRAVEEIKINQSLKKADIILITDGEDHLSHEFIQEWQTIKSEYKFNLYGILVEVSRQNELSSICDNLITISDITNDSAVAKFLNNF